MAKLVLFILLQLFSMLQLNFLTVAQTINHRFNLKETSFRNNFLKSSNKIECLNNGTRYSKGNNTVFYCNCTAEYFGDKCQHKNICFNNPCKNEGICSMVRIFDKIEYLCNCPSSYAGFDCQTKVKNICDSSPCLNNGICKIDSSSNGFYTCYCKNGFFGDHCEFQKIEKLFKYRNFDDSSLERLKLVIFILLIGIFCYIVYRVTTSILSRILRTDSLQPCQQSDNNSLLSYEDALQSSTLMEPENNKEVIYTLPSYNDALKMKHLT